MKLLNFLIEKRVVFMGLLLLFISVTFVSGSMEFRKVHQGRPNTLPYISGFTSNHGDLVKREEITTGKKEWLFGREVYVAIYGRAYGVGVGEGTLININVLGKPTVSTYEDGEDNVWEKRESNGEWEKKEDDVTTLYREVVPEDTEKTGYNWDSKGEVWLKEWLWQQTVGQAVTLRIPPLGVQGTFSTQGRWVKDSSTTTQSARKAEGDTWYFS